MTAAELRRPQVNRLENGIEPIEWKRVVEIARQDGPGGANPDNLRARFLRHLFAIPGIRPLANQRLEGLRRFAVKAWFRKRIEQKDLMDLLDSGFSTKDARQIIDHISGRRARALEIELRLAG